MIYTVVGSISRLGVDSDTDQEGYYQVAGLEKVLVNLQPASDQTTVVLDGAMGDMFTGFTDNLNIKTGDQYTISGINDKYIIRGVKDWSSGPIPHLELLLIKGDV